MKRSFTIIVVPSEAPVPAILNRFPPCMITFVPDNSSFVFVMISTLATAEIEDSASPLNPLFLLFYVLNFADLACGMFHVRESSILPCSSAAVVSDADYAFPAFCNLDPDRICAGIYEFSISSLTTEAGRSSLPCCDLVY